MKADLWRAVLSTLIVVAAPAAAAEPPACTPCTGIAVTDPLDLAVELAAEALEPDEVLFVKWLPTLDGSDAAAARAVRAAGAIPWLAVELATERPLIDNIESLDLELRSLAELAEQVGDGAYFQVDWRFAGQAEPDEYAFFIKRAAVAVSGAQPDGHVSIGLPRVDESYLVGLFAEEVAAYLDGVTLAPIEVATFAKTAALLQGLDPGLTVVADHQPLPPEPGSVLLEAGRLSAAGATVVLFESESMTPAVLAPFRRLAAEFRGDLSLDPYSVPNGAAEAWSFVRGEDLGLRVVVRSEPGASSVDLEFPDPQLHNPAIIDLESGAVEDLYGLRTGSGFEVEVVDPPSVMLLSLERMTAAELEGIEGLDEELTVADTRQMPVEEILRRLQAFEDGQARRLKHFEATNTAHLRFQAGTGARSFEATFRGPYFARQGESLDWAWEEFFVNGVKWRSKKIPEIPLLQAERAASLPIEISFSNDYRYSLRGTAMVEGRDCWEVDFEPAAALEQGSTLHRGTVWVDREIYARVRTRAVQLGLRGDVISNDETVIQAPLDAQGQPAPWSPESYFLPVRLVGQQIWSILSATTTVERELLLTDVRVNGPDFDQNREAVFASELTMLRDTDEGQRYLVVDEETGERVVETEPDRMRRFLLGGVLYDESLDFPVPLAGINWLWFDWRGTGTQANVFFAGPLVSVAVTDPSFRGSKFDLGFDAFALAIEGTDTVYRDGVEVPEEDVRVLTPSFDLKIGRSFGSFFKLDFEYELEWAKFSEADDAVDEFVVPSDHLRHGFTLTGRYNRRGYRLRAFGTHNIRSEWEPWGLPGNPDFETDFETFENWGASVGKTWHLPKFVKFGAELEYLDGSRLDRFSKYEFGIFGGVTVRGYQSDKVKAEEVLASHLTYGFDIGQLFRLELVGDTAWATDEATGLDNELLAGAGVVGTVVGPWRTVINLDVGAALAGPDDGFTVFVTVLKLFNR